MGETTLDILFKNGKPVDAVPGGSSFNSIISVGRTGLPCAFVGYTGSDAVGRQTVDFLAENNVSAEYFEMRVGEKSAVSLAYLDENGDAEYVFYKPTPKVTGSPVVPCFHEGDVLLFGSYFACCEGMRPQVMGVLTAARESKAIVYYDINFRASHRHELDDLLPAIQWNMQHSTLTRGSADDFDIMFGTRDAKEIYHQHIRPHCPVFICTGGAGLITVCTPTTTMEFHAPRIDDVVSTVGAGDNFNAGFIHAAVQRGLSAQQMADLDKEQWQELIDSACRFAGEACRSTNNYISREFASQLG